MPTFPTVERYEVHEIRHDGTTSGTARTDCSFLKNAEHLAEEWTEQAQERYAMESRGPVKPNPPSTFVVVRVTETREVVV